MFPYKKASFHIIIFKYNEAPKTKNDAEKIRFGSIQMIRYLKPERRKTKTK